MTQREMFKVRKREFPADCEGIIAHPDLSKLYDKFLGLSLANESTKFLIACKKGFSANSLYTTYINPKAKTLELNLDSDLRDKWINAFDNNELFGQTSRDLIDETRGKIIRLTDMNFLHRFLKSKPYLEYCIKWAIDVPKIAKVLKIDLRKTETKIVAALVLYLAGREAQGNAALTKLMKEQRKSGVPTQWIRSLQYHDAWF